MGLTNYFDKTKHLEVQRKLNSLITKDYIFFICGMYFTRNDGSQSMFVYQLTFNVLELKNDKCTKYIVSWKPKGPYASKRIVLHGDFFRNKNYKYLHRL